jgi:2-polyprenyl-3-methyl-5-hydroxy-6-metoxy-1,4-benzoquinol methylase
MAFRKAVENYETNYKHYIFQAEIPIHEPKMGINTFKDVKSKKERKKILELTIGILEDVSEGKIDKKKVSKLSNAIERNSLSLDINLLLKPSGYLIYTIHGLRAYANPGSQRELIDEIRAFASKSKLLRNALRSGKKALDYGCGVGWLGYVLSKNFGIETFGFDIDKNAISLGSFFEIENIFYPKILIKDGKEYFKLPFINEIFDVVISKAALFETPAKGMGSFICDDLNLLHYNISEIERVLKPNGILLIESNLAKETMIALIKGHKLRLQDVFYSKSQDKEWKLFTK